MEAATLLWIIILPFLGATLLGFLSLTGSHRWDRAAGWIASAALFLSFAPAFTGALEFLSNGSANPISVAEIGTWMNLGSYDIPFAFRFDAISGVMCLVITGVGLLIHIYSIGYMAHEKGSVRYFAFLNLFCGFMLVLVTASSLPLMFIGWEGVGLSSYLLIGYWYSDIEKARAGRKAFIVNRIGDAGLLMAMFLALTVFHSLDFVTIHQRIPLVAPSDPFVLEILAVLFFVGCVGKSAQFPLYIWLPDAMAGPTPVSALIHAATMVTSGVYLLARLAPLYAVTPIASEIVTWVGAFTALFAASIALVQDDIKKVLAFSTVSQLGFMILAMGLGIYWAGMFHLVTHAFFKGLLFLGAGSVIHALSGEQNIFKMGGLKTYTIGTTVTFFVGVMAIAGIPPFSGWFSKDAILYGAFESGNWVIFGMTVIAAILTTVYMTRLFVLVFLGVPNMPKTRLHEIHESPSSMLMPMWVLAFLSFIGGMMPFDTLLKGFFGVTEEKTHPGAMTETQLAWLITVVVTGVMFVTWRMYTAKSRKAKRAPLEFPLRDFVYRQYRYDDLVAVLSSRINGVASELCRLFDEQVIDRFVNGAAGKISDVAFAVSRLQSGKIQAYALTLMFGCLLIGWLILKEHIG